ncbi:MAG: tyrosine protein kinase [Sporichthyaceae bacterium]
MAHAVHPPESDLVLPLPGPGEQWDPHTIHTHYFGFAVPEAAIGVFAYIRYQPAFPLSQGGVVVFQGTDNISPIDAAHCNYELTMPWPQVDGNTIRTANGLQIEFLELGKIARISYASADGTCSFDVLAAAVTPLLVRGHVMPGEENHHDDPGRVPGGSEQFMHMTGELTLHGERHTVDCHYPRDRSWRQVRKETQGGVPVPPVGWSPMCFGEDLIFNQISFEARDTDPAWIGVYDVPAEQRTHHFAWLQQGDKTLDIVRVRRNVLQRQPQTFMSLRQEIEAEDETGAIHRFVGEAIATCTMPAWPNVSFHDSVYRWTDETGRVTHSTFQEIWFDPYQQAMKARAATR